MKKIKYNPMWFSSIVVLGAVAANVNADTVVMQKQNTNFSIDGSNGAKQGQQIYLYKTNTDNVNFIIKKKILTFVLMVVMALENVKQ